MQHFSLTVDAAALDAAIREMWEDIGVRGELQVRPQPDGRCRIDVIAERDLSPAQLEKLTGKRSG
jgi:hypothetical protein